MRWFSGTSSSILVTADESLLLAGQASWIAAEELDPGLSDYETEGERPSPDWGAEATLLLTILQLRQVEALVQELIGHEAATQRGSTLTRSIVRRLEDAGVDGDEFAYEAEAVSESLELLDALAASRLFVAHGYAVDGSITMTIGPSIPELSLLGIEGSFGGELNDEPDRLFHLARACTLEAARLLAQYKRSSPPPDGA